jgi:hypothetical protein
MTILRHRFGMHWPMILICGGLVVAAGCCKHRCCVSDRFREPRPFLPAAPRSPYLLPPANVPTTPAPPPASGSFVPPVAPPAETRQYPPAPSWLAPPAAPAPAPTTPPAERPPPEILLPESLPPSANGSSSSARPPQAGGAGGISPAPSASTPPAHLPGYTRVKRGVATGRRPTLDGFDALQRANFRTLVYLHAPQADVTALRQIASQRQLDLLPLEVTPENLPHALQQFNTIVGDYSRHPLYVFDDDGVRAGVLWYLHFRTVEALNDDAARIRARPLGFPEQGEEATPWLLAVQRYLSQR